MWWQKKKTSKEEPETSKKTTLPPTQSNNICWNCKALNSSDRENCINCGLKLIKRQPTNTPTPQPTPQADAPDMKLIQEAIDQIANSGETDILTFLKMLSEKYKIIINAYHFPYLERSNILNQLPFYSVVHAIGEISWFIKKYNTAQELLPAVNQWVTKNNISETLCNTHVDLILQEREKARVEQAQQQEAERIRISEEWLNSFLAEIVSSEETDEREFLKRVYSFCLGMFPVEDKTRIRLEIHTRDKGFSTLDEAIDQISEYVPIHPRFQRLLEAVRSWAAKNNKVIGKTPTGKTAEGKMVYLPQTIRSQGVYILGTNGTGKSTLIENMIIADLEEGLGLCLLDPHGDLTKNVIARCPENRVGDIIHINISTSAYSFGLNLFECADPTDIDAVVHAAEFVYHVFAKVWGVGAETPQLAQVLRHITYTLICNPGATFAEIPLLLQDADVREKLVSNVTLLRTRQFWQQYNKLSARDQTDRTNSTLNKVDAFLTNPLITNIVSQAQTTLNFSEIMDSGKVLLVQLSPRLEEFSNLIGAVIIGKLLDAAFSRSNIPVEQRKQYHIYADEFQRFATPDMKTFLTEARKFRVSLTLAHQTLAQIDEEIKQAALQSGTRIIFRITGDDSGVLAANFDHTPTEYQDGEEEIKAPTPDAVGFLLRNGHKNPKLTPLINLLQKAQMKLQEGFVPSAASTMDIPKHVRDEWKYTNPHARDVEFSRIQREEASNLNAYMQAHHEGEKAKIRRGITELNNLFYSAMTENTIPDPPLTAEKVQKYVPGFSIEWGIVTGFSTITHLDRFIEAMSHRFTSLTLETVQGFFLMSNHTGMRKAIIEEFKMMKWYDASQENDIDRCIEFVKVIRDAAWALIYDPILVPTGQFKPRMRVRTYADMENQIASELANMPNRQAKVKIIDKEYEILTLAPGSGLSGQELTDRILQIGAATCTNYCVPRSKVEQEVIERQEELMKTEPKVTRSSAVEPENIEEKIKPRSRSS